MNDMTKGKPIKQILLFMVPVLLGNLFQTFYNIVDLLIVGRCLGVEALAAVGMTGSISFLVVGWIIGMTSGFGILIAQAFGAGNDKLLKHYVAISAYICIVFAIGMTTILLLANDTMLIAMNTPEEIFSDTRGYIAIIYAGLTATILYNMLAAIARALGDSKTPLYFLAFSSVLNIGLDFLFVGVLPFGVQGAGYATVISQSVSAIGCLIYVLKKYPQIRFGREEAMFKWMTVFKLMGMGIPMGLQFSITAIGTMVVQSYLNLLGPVYIAAYTGCNKMQVIIMQFSIAVGSAVANFVGQNMGASRYDRVKEGVAKILVVTMLFNVISMLLAYFVCPHLIVLFAEDTTGELVQIASQYFRICLCFYIPLGWIFIYRNALQGLGRSFVPMLGGVFELVARSLVVYFLFDELQFVAVILTEPVAWVSALIPLIPFYYWQMNKIMKKEKQRMAI